MFLGKCLRAADARNGELAVVRSANTGVSAVIDDRGRIVDALALNAVGTIDAVVTAPVPRLLASVLTKPACQFRFTNTFVVAVFGPSSQ